MTPRRSNIWIKIHRVGHRTPRVGNIKRSCMFSNNGRPIVDSRMSKVTEVGSDLSSIRHFDHPLRSPFRRIREASATSEHALSNARTKSAIARDDIDHFPTRSCAHSPFAVRKRVRHQRPIRSLSVPVHNKDPSFGSIGGVQKVVPGVPPRTFKSKAWKWRFSSI